MFYHSTHERQTYPDNYVVLDPVLLLVGVVNVTAHELRLKNITGASIQTKQGTVQLGVFICRGAHINNMLKTTVPSDAYWNSYTTCSLEVEGDHVTA